MGGADTRAIFTQLGKAIAGRITALPGVAVVADRRPNAGRIAQGEYAGLLVSFRRYQRRPRGRGREARATFVHP